MHIDVDNLLGSTFECECGRVHSVPVKRYIYSKSVINDIPQILTDCMQGQPGRVAVIADARTWQVAGQAAYGKLSAGDIETRRIIVTDTNGRSPVTDEETCRWLRAAMAENRPEVALAVGSGVINDLTKWASYELGVPYAVLCTAASMNGYSAANVAARRGPMTQELTIWAREVRSVSAVSRSSKRLK